MKAPYKFDEFVAPRVKDLNVWPRNSHVSFPGWLTLYVRVSQRLVGHGLRTVIDLANIEAKKPGNGAFKALVAHIHKTYPGTPIYVEATLNQQFKAGLLKHGFVVNTNDPSCFLLLP